MVEQPDREDLLRKIKAINELAKRGGTEAEALAAAEKVAMLLARYNIKREELEANSASAYIDITRVNGKYNETWRKDCYAAAARMYMCNYFWNVRPWDKGARVVHCVIGEPHNVAVAVEMGAYFEATINRLANEGVRQVRDSLDGHTSRHRFIRSFRLAAAQRLTERVKSYVRRAQAGDVIDSETGTKLPALAGLYEQQRALYEAWLKAHNITVNSVQARDQTLSGLGTLLGYRAGENIALTTQLKEGSKSAQFALR